MDCSLPSSSVHRILQARILEWVATPSSRGYSQPRNWTCLSCITGGFLIVWTTMEALWYYLAAELLKLLILELVLVRGYASVPPVSSRWARVGTGRTLGWADSWGRTPLLQAGPQCFWLHKAEGSFWNPGLRGWEKPESTLLGSQVLGQSFRTRAQVCGVRTVGVAPTPETALLLTLNGFNWMIIYACAVCAQDNFLLDF